MWMPLLEVALGRDPDPFHDVVHLTLPYPDVTVALFTLDSSLRLWTMTTHFLHIYVST